MFTHKLHVPLRAAATLACLAPLVAPLVAPSVAPSVAPLVARCAPITDGVAGLVDDAKQRWEALAPVTLTDDGYRDKKRLCMDLDAYFEGAAPSETEAKRAAKLVSKLVGRDSPRGLVWRVEELRGRLLAAVDAKGAAKAFEAALAAYPDESYPAPAKQSYFQHLVVEAVLARWTASGMDDAEALLESIAAKDPRFAAFLPNRLEERYLANGEAERLRALYQRLERALQPRLPELARELRERRIPDVRLTGGDPKKLYVVLGADREQQSPRDLVLVMPGGNGQAFEFKDWIEDLATPLLDRFVFAILSAPQWSAVQAENFVWVTSRFQREYDAKFPVEEFAREVAAELRGVDALNVEDAFLFAWSSGGPAAYATVLSKDDTFQGAYVLASVFKPDQLDLKRAQGRRFWLEQGTQDSITAIRFARQAQETLERKGAEVHLVEFDGGHGFAMPNAHESLAAALEWLGR